MLVFTSNKITFIFADYQYCNIYWLFSESNPTCTSNTTTNSEAVEGEHITYCCEWKYQGNLTPNMKFWKQNRSAYLQATNESSVGTVKYSIVVEMKPSYNGESFICHTYFDKPPSKGPFADNVPIHQDAFNALYTFPPLCVYCKYCTRICSEMLFIFRFFTYACKINHR